MIGDKNDLISIIIPTYKRNSELERAIRCAVKQTYDNKEIVVVDDNAKEPYFRNAVKKIVSKYPDVKLIQNKKNIGGALSRNEGIRCSKGTLIAFLDDDDECTPDRLEKQYSIYLQNKNKNLGLVYSNDRGIDFGGNIIYQHMLSIIAKTSSWLVPKEVLLSVGCFENIPSEQDTTLLFNILKAGYNIFFVPEKLIIWNIHNSKNGISGVKEKNIIGTERLRKLYRANYDLLDTSEQIKNVEYRLSVKLLPKYVYNKRKEDAKRELKWIVQTKPFAISTVKSVLKYLVPALIEKTRN